MEVLSSLTSCEELDQWTEVPYRSKEEKQQIELILDSVEDKSKWLAAIEHHVIETQATSLDLNSKGLKAEDAKLIFRCLPNSEVTELILAGNNLSGGMEDLVQALLKSKISKLDICECSFSNEEMLRLMSVLKDTRVTKLRVRNEGQAKFDEKEGNEFESYLRQSGLTVLDFGQNLYHKERVCRNNHRDYSPYIPCGVTNFLATFYDSSLTSLCLTAMNLSEGDFYTLCGNLSCSAIVDLSFYGCELEEDIINVLSFSLKDSKLVRLNLSFTFIGDTGMDLIAIGLMSSKLTTLELARCAIKGASVLGRCLSDTQIKNLNLSNNMISEDTLLSFPGFLHYSNLVTLDLAHCGLDDKLGQKLMRSLQYSKVEKLDVSHNWLAGLSAAELRDVIEDTELTYINLSSNCFCYYSMGILSDCLQLSKLEKLDLNENKGKNDEEDEEEDEYAFVYGWCDYEHEYESQIDPRAYGNLLHASGEYLLDLKSLSLRDNDCFDTDAGIIEVIAEDLEGAEFTHLDLSGNKLAGGVTCLAPSLESTAITHLNLSENRLQDDGIKCLAQNLKKTKIIDLDVAKNNITNCGAQALAENLKDTHIINLNISNNSIENCGAKALAACLKNTSILHLDLSKNKIKDEGIVALAQHAEGTFVTVLDLNKNPGTRQLLVEGVLLNNKITVHRFVNLFKRITSETYDKFCFDESACNGDVDVFLDECVNLYKSILEQPSAKSVLLQEKNLSVSREQIVSLFEEFPQEFATFIMSKIDTSVTQLVNFLKRTEELGLEKLVELLLLDRPGLMVDQSEGILHPYVYKLLHKYKQPLFNVAVEPEGKTKIIRYFSENTDLEGAADVVSLLQTLP